MNPHQNPVTGLAVPGFFCPFAVSTWRVREVGFYPVPHRSIQTQLGYSFDVKSLKFTFPFSRASPEGGEFAPLEAERGFLLQKVGAMAGGTLPFTPRQRTSSQNP